MRIHCLTWIPVLSYIAVRETLCYCGVGFFTFFKQVQIPRLFGSTECPTCEGLSLTLFTADPVEAGAKMSWMVLRSRVPALAAGRQGDIISPLCILFPFTVFLVLLDLETSGGKNCVLFLFHTIRGAIGDHVLSFRLRWGLYMIHKHKYTAHCCLCTGKERGVKAGAFFTLWPHPEAPII